MYSSGRVARLPRGVILAHRGVKTPLLYKTTLPRSQNYPSTQGTEMTPRGQNDSFKFTVYIRAVCYIYALYFKYTGHMLHIRAVSYIYGLYMLHIRAVCYIYGPYVTYTGTNTRHYQLMRTLTCGDTAFDNKYGFQTLGASY